jgi:hypothetical protein
VIDGQRSALTSIQCATERRNQAYAPAAYQRHY